MRKNVDPNLWLGSERSGFLLYKACLDIVRIRTLYSLGALYLGTREERPADVTEHVLELGDALQSEEGQHLSRELSH